MATKNPPKGPGDITVRPKGTKIKDFAGPTVSDHGSAAANRKAIAVAAKRRAASTKKGK